MFNRARFPLFALLTILLTLAACGNAPTTPAAKNTVQPTGATYAPVINPTNFVAALDNPYLPLKPGMTLISEGTKGGAKQHTEISVTHETKAIFGVTCMVVRDKVFLNGQLAEDTTDWFAQDKEGNVWYFGEDSKDYQNGVVTTRLGSFEAGVDGAQPGIIMKAHPEVGQSYHQEYYKGKAEDMAQIVSLAGTASVPYGHFNNLLVTKEWTPLEPGAIEHKYYAPGVGWVLTTFEGSSDQEKLVKITSGNAG
jgi:hypothetical protein